MPIVSPISTSVLPKVPTTASTPRPNTDTGTGAGIGQVTGTDMGTGSGTGGWAGEFTQPVQDAAQVEQRRIAQGAFPTPAGMTSRPMGYSSQSYSASQDPQRNPFVAQYQQASQLANLLNDPQRTALQSQGSLLQARQGLLSGQYDAQERYLRGDYSSDVARNNLAFSGLDLDRADLGSSRERIGLDFKGRGVDRGYIGQMQGLADQALANQIAGIDAGARTDIRNRDSDYTARGSWFAPFHSIENRETNEAADRDRFGARLGRAEREAGWQRDLRQFDVADERSNLDYRDLGTAERRLDLEAQSLGLQRADLDRILQQGIEQLGYDESIDATELASMLESNSIEQQQLANQILMDAYMYGGLMAQDPAFMRAFGDMLANQPRS